MEKNQQFQVTITDYSSEGLGIGKTEGQFVWFIKDTVIGDEVIAAATKVKKHYGFARLVKLVTPSPARETPACPIARPPNPITFPLVLIIGNMTRFLNLS